MTSPYLIISTVWLPKSITQQYWWQNTQNTSRFRYFSLLLQKRTQYFAFWSIKKEKVWYTCFCNFNFCFVTKETTTKSHGLFYQYFMTSKLWSLWTMSCSDLLCLDKNIGIHQLSWDFNDSLSCLYFQNSPELTFSFWNRFLDFQEQWICKCRNRSGTSHAFTTGFHDIAIAAGYSCYLPSTHPFHTHCDCNLFWPMTQIIGLQNQFWLQLLLFKRAGQPPTVISYKFQGPRPLKSFALSDLHSWCSDCSHFQNPW